MLSLWANSFCSECRKLLKRKYILIISNGFPFLTKSCVTTKYEHMLSSKGDSNVVVPLWSYVGGFICYVCFVIVVGASGRSNFVILTFPRYESIFYFSVMIPCYQTHNNLGCFSFFFFFFFFFFLLYTKSYTFKHPMATFPHVLITWIMCSS